MKVSDKRPLKRAGLELTALGLGTAPLGGLYAPVALADARATIEAAFAAGIRHFDTAPMYGLGRAEHLVGERLREEEPGGFVVSTKVGRLMSFDRPGRPLPPEAARNAFDSGWHNGLSFREVFDYSYDAILRSYDDSRQRTGLSKLDLLFVHDIGRVTHGDAHAHHWSALTRGGGFRALAELRSAGLIAGFGLGVNENEAILEAMEEADLDVCLLAGRYTLLDGSAADALLPKARARDVALVMGGVFNSGILASTSGRKKYNYVDAPPGILAKAEALEAECRAFGVPLQAAAIQFPFRHPATANVVIGAKTASQLQQNVAWFEQPIPDALWRSLDDKGLIASP
ncbi:aldo/keto reductase [Methylobacterium indicum]|uniref:Pyridoxal 4-dehydrogenase n=1 Tax=Methylobacterium indicum TaxID=1775910 RepID=A0ABR5HF01_9HYPH|nr:aldo/keto reductase [Methylobacterium indicum]KMO17373.1 pyridoxal 4-dehydrogenase [Methylobacterium indicum]KMO25071.1 pyridoxal 4-dehydrogenase [Methylobacterium indicum]